MKTFLSLIFLAAGVTAYAQKMPVKSDKGAVPKLKQKAPENAKVLKTDTVYITGKVANFAKYKDSANSVQVIINDLAFGQQLTYRAKIKNDGTYRLAFLKTGPQDVMFQYHEDLENILVNPGDHLQIDFDAAGMEKSLSFSGAGATMNKDRYDFQKAMVNDPGLGYKGNNFARFMQASKSEEKNGPEEHKKFLADRYARETVFLNDYIKKHKLDPIFIGWAKADLKYDYFDQLLRYVWMHPSKTGQSSKDFKIPASYYSAIDSANINELSGSISSNYGSFLHEYQRYFYKKYLGEKWGNGDDRMALLFKQQAGLSKDVILSHTLHDWVQNRRFDQVKAIIDKYKENTVQPTFKARLARMYQDEVDKLNNYNAATVAQSATILKTDADSIFNNIITKYKGKAVYIDLWATWCGPCIGEMPGSKELAGKLKGKDIVFLYVCVESEEKKWKTMVKELGIDGGENLLLTNNDYKALCEKFQISGIPRYLLVDKGGRVFNENAQRPSESGLMEDIEKLLAAR
ncbi:TlpA family protein disulfide reductase [Mucilaginibacter myungsuensis]|uniref:TlpA family protein disulfide reductase n=1 Tax=Mucilaginibacter myungsuensis TaxID=649104 RepID=A0A929KTD9_9SPHI|nr:TlpA disulfide reductase family protein [Mucilaginibacter myungsuensis]MBE9661209.1 TlpA family protein disulfide reductase [Mucilaginibacter myungsuensis]MDN3597353.1 TlpA disulfide reductase family protein [Mucilaginibacter myungsuensis]